MLFLYCVCYVVFIFRACCVVLSCMLYCTYSYVCICVLWQGRTALADCPEFKLLIKSSNQLDNIRAYLDWKRACKYSAHPRYGHVKIP